MCREPGEVTLPAVLTAVRDFLAVWAAQCLYHNGIYEKEAFHRKKYMDLPVHAPRAGHLQSYLTQFANSVVRVLVRGTVHEAVVLIHDESSMAARRRYVANFSQFVAVHSQVSTLDFLEADVPVHAAKIDIAGFSWTDLYTDLRSMMFLHLQDLERAPLEGVFFKLFVNCDSREDLHSEWVKVYAESDPKPVDLVPIGEASVGFVCFDLHTEYVGL